MAETLDTLGEKLAAGLAAMAVRFDTVDERLERVDQRLERVDQRLAGVDQRLDGVAQRLGGVDQRLDGVDQRFDGVAQQFEGVAHQLAGINERFVSVDRRFDELGSSLRTQIEAVDSKVGLVLEKVEHLITRDRHHSAVSARLDTRLDDHELRLIALESEKPPSR